MKNFLMLAKDHKDEDILCSYGDDGQKFILSDTFGCWDEGRVYGAGEQGNDSEVAESQVVNRNNLCKTY